MPFNQLTTLCWVLDPKGGPDGEDLAHSATEAEALKYLKDSYPPEDYGHLNLTVARVPAPCWLVVCDGDCGDDLESDEYAHIHCATRTEAEQMAEAYDWTVTKDGQVFCKDDAPTDRSLEELAVVEQIPGQLTLDGGEVPRARDHAGH